MDTTRGAGVKVAVIDTGVDGTSPTCSGAVVGGTDVSGIGSPNGQSPVGDTTGHGTWWPRSGRPRAPVTATA